MFDFKNNPVFEQLTFAMDGLERREKILANNLANMNTPGYQARDLDFQRVMDDHASQIVQPDQDLKPEESADGHLGSVLDRLGDVWDNAVTNLHAPPTLQDQMVRLNQNTLQYAAVAQALGEQIARYKNVLSEGKHI